MSSALHNSGRPTAPSPVNLAQEPEDWKSLPLVWPPSAPPPSTNYWAETNHSKIIKNTRLEHKQEELLDYQQTLAHIEKDLIAKQRHLQYLETRIAQQESDKAKYQQYFNESEMRCRSGQNDRDFYQKNVQEIHNQHAYISRQIAIKNDEINLIQRMTPQEYSNLHFHATVSPKHQDEVTRLVHKHRLNNPQPTPQPRFFRRAGPPRVDDTTHAIKVLEFLR